MKRFSSKAFLLLVFIAGMLSCAGQAVDLNRYEVYYGDINRDGRDNDIFLRGVAIQGNTTPPPSYVFHEAANGSHASPIEIDPAAVNLNLLVKATKNVDYIIGDANDDGMDDAFIRGKTANDTAIVVSGKGASVPVVLASIASTGKIYQADGSLTSEPVINANVSSRATSVQLTGNNVAGTIIVNGQTYNYYSSEGIVDYTIAAPQAPTLTMAPALANIGIDQTKTIPGKFEVSSGGQATYQIEIQTALGTAGFKPDVSLFYSSGGGNGIAGLGWSLNAYSSITRCRQTHGQDRNAAPITWSAADRFCWNGQRLLVQNNATYGSPGSTYKTEIDNYAKITAVGGSTGHPNYFKVEHKSGIVEYYGNTADSKYQLDSNNSQSVLTWAINRREDSAANDIQFSYHDDSSGHRIATIDYAFGSSQTNSAQIEFIYEDRSDVIRGYVAGLKNETYKRLTRIISTNNQQEIRRYEISYYEGSALSSNDQLSRLSGLQECTFNVCGIKTEFEWKIPDYRVSTSAYSFSFPQGVSDYAFGDINGDGVTDITWSDKAQWDPSNLTTYDVFSYRPVRYAFGVIDANGQFRFQVQSYLDGNESKLTHNGRKVKLIDVNGDGRSDLVVSNGDSSQAYYSEITQSIHFAKPENGTWKFHSIPDKKMVTEASPVFIDLNADGLVDHLDWSVRRGLPWDVEVKSRIKPLVGINQKLNGDFTPVSIQHDLPNSNYLNQLVNDFIQNGDMSYGPYNNQVNASFVGNDANAPISSLMDMNADFNGDGVVDLIGEVYMNYAGCEMPDPDDVDTRGCHGNTAKSARAYVVSGNVQQGLKLNILQLLNSVYFNWDMFEDLNNDGLTDVVAAREGQWVFEVVPLI